MKNLKRCLSILFFSAVGLCIVAFLNGSPSKIGFRNISNENIPYLFPKFADNFCEAFQESGGALPETKEEIRYLFRDLEDKAIDKLQAEGYGYEKLTNADLAAFDSYLKKRINDPSRSKSFWKKIKDCGAIPQNFELNPLMNFEEL